MKRTLLLLTCCLMSSICVFSQRVESKLDYRLGIGTSFLGTGDLYTLMLENELNYEVGRFVTISGGFGFGRSIEIYKGETFDGVAMPDEGISTFFQLNSNIFFSPFTNKHKNDFRIGTGLSWYTVKEILLGGYNYNFQTKELYNIRYFLEERNAIGYNIIIENTYAISKRIILGAKAFTQLYNNGDINTGAMVKVGVAL